MSLDTTARLARAALIPLLAFPSVSPADEIVFANGDRLTGTLVRMQAGTITFRSEVVGPLSLALTDVATVATDDPVTLQLADGSVVEERLSRADPGTARLGGDDAPLLALSEVRRINPERVRWRGDVSLGVRIERGNTDGQEVDLAFDFRRESDVRRIRVRGFYEADRSRTSDEPKQRTTERELRGTAQHDRLFGNGWFWRGLVRAEKDGIKELNLRTEAGVGIGRRILDSDRTSWSLVAGPSWVHEDYDDRSLDTDYAAASLTSEFEFLMSDSITLFNDVQWVPSLREFNDIQQWLAQVGLRVRLTRRWFGEARVEWELDTEPAANTERKDMDYILAVGWTF
jgi:putative salt-induced outer membrane protein YdiY